jgi:hypothetical protein
LYESKYPDVGFKETSDIDRLEKRFLMLYSPNEWALVTIITVLVVPVLSGPCSVRLQRPLQEHPDRLQEETLKVVQVLSEPEGQLSNAVKLRAKRLCSSWGEARRRGPRWGGGESSASGADILVESKDDASPSTSAERDESTEAVSSRGAHLLHKPGGGPSEGVEEVAGIMRLTMNSPGAGAAAQVASGRFETAPEESSSGGEREVALELEGG